VSTLADAIGIVPGTAGFRALSARIEPPASGLVRCRPVAVGCCGTDRALMTGRYGGPAYGHDDIITGHETVVCADEAAPGITPGRWYALVVREPVATAPAPFRRSPHLAHDPAHFVERGLSGLDGGLRPALRCAATSLVPLPDGLRPEQAVWVEPMACIVKAVRVFEHCWAGIAGGDDEVVARAAIVLGAGSCGLLATALLRQHGFTVTALDLAPATSSRAALVRMLGADYVVGPSAPGPSVRLLFDACGSPSAVEHLTTRLGPTGGIVDFGIAEGAHATADAVRRTTGNHFRIGSINAGRDDWRIAAEAVARLAREHPAFFTRATAVVTGLDLAAMVAALDDPSVVKPVVLPT
jgi:threonine dehydrogenase-like Zn-dependent dehydrogenase